MRQGNLVCGSMVVPFVYEGEGIFSISPFSRLLFRNLEKEVKSFPMPSPKLNRGAKPFPKACPASWIEQNIFPQHSFYLMGHKGIACQYGKRLIRITVLPIFTSAHVARENNPA